MFDLIRRLAGLMMELGRLIQCIDFYFPRNRFVHFLVVVGINTLLSFVIYSLAIINGAEVWVALIASMITGTWFNFITMGSYVFRDLALCRLPRFASCYLLVYATNLSLIENLSMWFIDKIFTQFILLLPIAVFPISLYRDLNFQKTRIWAHPDLSWDFRTKGI